MQRSISLILLSLPFFQTSLFAQALGIEKRFHNEQVIQLIFSLSGKRTICTELEIVDDQLRKIQTAALSYQKSTNVLIDDFRLSEARIKLNASISDKPKAISEIRASLRSEIEELSNQVIKELSDVLLPHQFKRVKQIARQKHLSMITAGNKFNIIYELAEEIGLNGGKMGELRKAIDEAQKQYSEDVFKAEKKAERAILSALTTEQKKKLKDIIGELYFD